MAFPQTEQELREFILRTVGPARGIPLARGTGSPEGVVVADLGIIYEDGGSGDIYRKVADPGLATGWALLS